MSQLMLFDDPPPPQPVTVGPGRIERRDDGWFIVDFLSDCREIGAYDSRREAEESLRGMRRTLAEMEGQR